MQKGKWKESHKSKPLILYRWLIMLPPSTQAKTNVKIRYACQRYVKFKIQRFMVSIRESFRKKMSKTFVWNPRAREKKMILHKEKVEMTYETRFIVISWIIWYNWNVKIMASFGKITNMAKMIERIESKVVQVCPGDYAMLLPLRYV